MATVDFGEYEALLPCNCVNAALSFSRELFSREFVVQKVTNQGLAIAVKENETRWRGLSRIHAGHVVVSVDDVPVRGLSSRQFTDLWYPTTIDENPKMSSTHRRVRFRDRKRAEVEVEMHKQWTSSGPLRFTPVQDDAELQTKLREAHELIWSHQLTEAYEVLRSLTVGSDPMVCLLAVELEVVRVLVSKDKLYAKQALRAADQAVAWLEDLSELSSLSYSSRKQMQLALAEALFLSALLRLGRGQRLAAIAIARRCAAIYVELHEKFFTRCNAALKRDRLLMPENELLTFQKRIRFGLGVLHVGGALALQSALDWISGLLNGACDIKKGVEYLLDCGSAYEGSHSHLQVNWVALLLMYSSGALRLIRQRSEQGVGDQVAKAIAACKQAALQRHPKALIFLWSQANTSNFDGDWLNLEVELARVPASDERVHLVRFDVGYRQFQAREFDRSSTQFMAICKCASAPSKLRGLSGLFLAVGYLLPSQNDVLVQDEKVISSVRLLLRSARRFLTLRLEDKSEDFESASLHERLGDYLDKSDEYLQLLPWEILYVHGHSTKRIVIATRSDVVQRQHHFAALGQLDRLSKSSDGGANQKNYEIQVALLHAIVLFNLQELDACEDELKKLWSALPQGTHSRSSSALGRLLSPRSSRPPPAFIAPVAWFYQLRLLLERRCSRSTLTSIENGPLSPRCSSPREAVSSFADVVQESPYTYHYVYNVKLQALNKLVTRLANDKIDNTCSSPTACSSTY